MLYKSLHFVIIRGVCSLPAPPRFKTKRYTRATGECTEALAYGPCLPPFYRMLRGGFWEERSIPVKFWDKFEVIGRGPHMRPCSPGCFSAHFAPWLTVITYTFIRAHTKFYHINEHPYQKSHAFHFHAENRLFSIRWFAHTDWRIQLSSAFTCQRKPCASWLWDFYQRKGLSVPDF